MAGYEIATDQGATSTRSILKPIPASRRDRVRIPRS